MNHIRTLTGDTINICSPIRPCVGKGWMLNSLTSKCIFLPLTLHLFLCLVIFEDASKYVLRLLQVVHARNGIHSPLVRQNSKIRRRFLEFLMTTSKKPAKKRTYRMPLSEFILVAEVIAAYGKEQKTNIKVSLFVLSSIRKVLNLRKNKLAAIS
jgi:hypothetical protein